MGSQRTTNKDIVDAIAKQATSIDALVATLTTQAMPIEASVIAATPSKTDSPKVDDAYLTHQKGKSQAHATDKGCEVVLYARVNKAGETKLAYAQRDRYDSVITGQPSHIGAVASFQPA